MIVEDVNVVDGIRQIRALISASRKFRDNTKPMVLDTGDPYGVPGRHPMDDCISIMRSVENTLLAVYGRELYKGADRLNSSFVVLDDSDD